MHFNTNVLTLAVTAASLLLSTANAAIIPDSVVRRSTVAEPTPNTLIPQPAVAEDHDDRLWTTKIRDTVVGSLFGKSTRHGTRREQQKRLSQTSKIISQYDGDVVLRFNLSSPDEAKALAEASHILYLDVWSTTKSHADIRMAEDMVPSLLGLLPKSMQHSHFRLMHDLARTAQDTYTGASNVYSKEDMVRLETKNLFFQNYQPPSVILPWMKLLESLFPGFVEVFSIGKSYEGREIQALRVGTKDISGNKKLTIIVAGAAHAREWISVSTVCYLAYSLISRYGKRDMGINTIVDHFDWVFIPTLNVDGYAYTWDADRLWRKNRQPTGLSFCKGIDLDRAYNFHFDGSPSSQGNPCSDMFPGTNPFEATEAKTFADFARNLSAEGTPVVGLLDFHSYSQQILYPYSYSCDNMPPDLENLEELGFGLAKAIRQQSGEHYEVTSACEGTGFAGFQGAGGSMMDFFYADYRVPYAYQIRLRDTGSYGFLLPKENIIPAGEESLAALKHFGQFILDDGSPVERQEARQEKELK
ncbi:hypothetical protein DFP73DRAFT_559920 [Morchella snyderi]|nr:hypothetical protein DFP73DRAFT_559920 [Morchella snyderi]